MPLRRFLTEALSGDRVACLATLEQHDTPNSKFINRQWEWETFNVDGDRWLSRGDTALMAACRSGNFELVRDLLKKGADVKSKNSEGADALRLSCWRGQTNICAVLLENGAEPNLVITGWTSLGVAARKDFLPVCLVLLAHGADLTTKMFDGRNALDWYGSMTTPALSDVELGERVKSLKEAFAEGPHPTQVQRRADERWARRWPFVKVVVCCDFQPLAARKLFLLMLNPPLPPNVAIPGIPIGTPEQKRALLHMQIFGHLGLWKLITSFL